MNEKKGRNFLDVLVDKGIVNSCGFRRYETLFGAYATFGIGGADYQLVETTSRKDPLEAIMRVMTKAYERYCLSKCSHHDPVTFKAEDFSNPNSHRFGCDWIDPRLYVPLSKKQRKISCVKEFSEELPINWVQGRRLKMDADHKIIATEKVYIPRDMVYCGCDDENTIYRATSSGAAAGVSREEAILNALSELIERDAIMRTYLKHESPYIITEGALPRDICAEKRRIEKLNINSKKTVYTLCLPGYLPTALVVILSGWYPFVTFGAAASFIAFEDAMRKALEEAEYNYWKFLDDESNHMYLSKRGVITPGDHGIYYAGLLNRRSNLEWLWSGEELNALPRISKNLADAIRELDLSSVILSERKSETKEIPLWVVRILSPKLIPISYGNNMIHYGHPSINFDIYEGALKEPHFFNVGSV